MQQYGMQQHAMPKPARPQPAWGGPPLAEVASMCAAPGLTTAEEKDSKVMGPL